MTTTATTNRQPIRPTCGHPDAYTQLDGALYCRACFARAWQHFLHLGHADEPPAVPLVPPQNAHARGESDSFARCMDDHMRDLLAALEIAGPADEIAVWARLVDIQRDLRVLLTLWAPDGAHHVQPAADDYHVYQGDPQASGTMTSTACTACGRSYMHDAHWDRTFRAGNVHAS